jgi:DNA-binding NarL/FixJ family response regulator
MKIELLIGCIELAWGLTLCDCLHAAQPGSFECAVSAAGDVVREVATRRPDVILLERKQGADAVHDLVAAIARQSPDSRVLLVCETCTRELVLDAIEGGAQGCLHKDSSMCLLVDAVWAVQRGETWFSRSALLQALRNPPAIHTHCPRPDTQLTPREEQIVRLIGAGLSNKEIGRRLDISDHTVKTHLHHVYVKLQRSGRYKAFLAQPGVSAAVPHMQAMPAAGSFVAAQLREG